MTGASSLGRRRDGNCSIDAGPGLVCHVSNQADRLDGAIAFDRGRGSFCPQSGSLARTREVAAPSRMEQPGIVVGWLVLLVRLQLFGGALRSLRYL
jgi:hypothetical protein